MAESPPIKRAKVEPDGQAQDNAPPTSSGLDTADTGTSTSSTTTTCSSNKGPLTWPAEEVPVEVFNLIAEYLPREEVQAMRLVNKEFDFKTSPFYFKNVVVPFAPNLFAALTDVQAQAIGQDPTGSSNETADANADANATVGLDPAGAMGVMLPSSADATTLTATTVTAAGGAHQHDAASSVEPPATIDTGLHVFETFAPHIRSFALSLELKEADLARPPIKLTQEIKTASWGIYRWPRPEYSRYQNVAKLEATADDTRRMTVGFSKLVHLKELGLTLDAGLGFLNAFAPSRRKPRVFASSRYDPPMTSTLKPYHPINDRYMKWPRYAEMQRMLIESGHATEENAHEAIEYLLKLEGRTLNDVLCNLDGSLDLPRELPSVQVPPGYTYPSETQLRRIPPFQDLPTAAMGLILTYAGINAMDTPVDENPSTVQMALEPASLNNAQLELLLELKWAHDALVQSFVIAAGDNGTTFANLTSFTVARISSSLVHKLAVQELWKSLASIKEFHLSVIPDWRTVVKTGSGVEERRISPIDAVQPVYDLLHNYVGKCENLRTIHFEWICGGETGEGLSQRTRFILPAPFVPQMSSMTTLQANDVKRDLLDLPYLRTLKLRNCWSAPHILLAFMHKAVSQSLEELELQSVSITATPTVNAQQPIIIDDRRKNHPFPLCAGGNANTQFLGHWVPGAHNPLGGLQVLAGGNLAAVGGMGGLAAQLAATMNNPAAPIAPGLAQFFAGVPALGIPPPGPGFAHPNAPQPFIPIAPQLIAPMAANAHAFAPPAPSWMGPSTGELATPRVFSWAHILNEITPGQTIRQQFYRELTTEEENRDNDLHGEARPWLARGIGTKKIKSLKLQSCGYVLVDDPMLLNVDMLPNDRIHIHMANNTTDALDAIDRFMLSHDDTFLGKIVDWIEPGEKNILYHMFGMQIPDHVTPYDLGVIDPGFRADGFTRYGMGRFSGGFVNGATVPAE